MPLLDCARRGYQVCIPADFANSSNSVTTGCVPNVLDGFTFGINLILLPNFVGDFKWIVTG
jgi:hypothetical protein